ncbi:MAG: DUF5688 family protein [Lachnospiraceae bacterium]|nr:DUF5688 family protein [Lachnospiraceae bacterium]
MIPSTALQDTTALSGLPDTEQLPKLIREGVLPKFLSPERFAQPQMREAVTMDIADLHLAFYLPLAGLSDDTKTASILLTKKLIKRLDMTRQELYRLAVDHLALDAVVEPFESVIASLLPFTVPEMRAMDDAPPGDQRMPICFVSNRQRFFGAAAILCPKTRALLEEQLGSPFLLLPSSVHEVLCLPADQSDREHAAWSDMVREINDTCLDPAERLSDHAYLCMEGALLPV